jgi:VWFA-related protein
VKSVPSRAVVAAALGICLLLLAPAPSGRLAAQSGTPAQTQAGDPQATQQPPKPVFRTGAELVRVDVAVLDKRGVPVSNLSAADFELEEDGAAQEIKTFQFVEANGQPQPDDEVSLTIRSRSHAAAEAAKDNVRVFLIFWDEYHIGQMASAAGGGGCLAQFVRSAFGPTDIVGFMDPLTPIDAIRFTRDRLELFEQVRRLVGRSGVYVPTRSAVEDAHLQRGDVERLRSEVTMSAVKSAAVHLGGMRDGRKTIILISEGLRGMKRDATSLMTDLTRAANDNNTAIYAIDPRGFGQQRFPSQWEPIANETGGDYFRSNDLGEAFRKVVVQSSGYYLLGYSPTERSLDGRFHKIKVRVKPSGLEVRARSGYWAPSVAEVERARVKAAEAELPPDVLRALSELPAASGRRAVDFWAGVALDNGRPALRLAWTPRPGAVSPKVAQVSAVVASGDTAVYEGPVSASGVFVPVPPGLAKVTVSIMDDTGEIIDREVKQLDVPEPAGPALWITSPALFRAQNVREFRSLERGPGATPFAGREFVRSDRLLISFEVHGTSAPDAKVSARMISQWGKDLAELPLAPRTGDGPYEIELPLATVARGEFLVAISAAAGAHSTRAVVPLRIVR